MAPNDSAISSRSATVSTAITVSAPAAFAACTAQRPTGPRPSTATLPPGSRSGLGDRVVAGAHHVAGEQGDVVGEPSGTRRRVRFAFGTSSCSACAPCSEPSVAPWPKTRPRSHLWKSPAAAEEALAAGGAVGARGPGRRRRRRDLVAGREHRADVLVADHEAGLDLDPPVVDVEVGAADSARLDPDHGVVGGDRLRIRPLLDPHLSRRLEGHCPHRRGL